MAKFNWMAKVIKLKCCVMLTFSIARKTRASWKMQQLTPSEWMVQFITNGLYYRNDNNGFINDISHFRKRKFYYNLIKTKTTIAAGTVFFYWFSRRFLFIGKKKLSRNEIFLSDLITAIRLHKSHFVIHRFYVRIVLFFFFCLDRHKQNRLRELNGIETIQFRCGHHCN